MDDEKTFYFTTLLGTNRTYKDRKTKKRVYARNEERGKEYMPARNDESFQNICQMFLHILRM